MNTIYLLTTPHPALDLAEASKEDGRQDIYFEQLVPFVRNNMSYFSKITRREYQGILTNRKYGRSFIYQEFQKVVGV